MPPQNLGEKVGGDFIKRDFHSYIFPVDYYPRGVKEGSGSGNWEETWDRWENMMEMKLGIVLSVSW